MSQAEDVQNFQDLHFKDSQTSNYIYQVSYKLYTNLNPYSWTIFESTIQ